MRKITKQIAEAFNRGERRQVGNTFTDGHEIFLHGNRILERRGDGVYFSLAGWNTQTTRAACKACKRLQLPGTLTPACNFNKGE